MLNRKLFPVVVLVSLVAGAKSASAAFIATIEQIGSNVVFTGSGSINTGSATITSTFDGADFTNPGAAAFHIGPSTTDIEATYSSITGPANFGSFALDQPTSETGDYFGFNRTNRDFTLPTGYTSGSQLSDSSTFAGQTLSSMGITAGTYTYSFGSSPNADTFTINASIVPVPEPASLSLFGLGGLCLLRRRRKIVSSGERI
jgi:hypothetical protein